MQIKSTPVQARLRNDRALRLLGLAVFVAGLSFTHHAAHAQAASAPAGNEDAAPSERAKRDAEKVFHWIMIHSDKPRKVRDGTEKPATAAAPVVAAPKPVAAKVAKASEGSAEGSVAPAPPALAPARSAAPAAATAAAVPAAPPVSTVDNEAARMSNAANAANAALARSAPPPAAMPDTAARPAVAAPEEAEPEALVPVAQVEPQFPRTVMLDLRKGTVRVRFEVLPDGSVSTPSVVATTSARLNRAALAAVSQWRFQPVREAQEGMVELGFNLD